MRPRCLHVLQRSHNRKNEEKSRQRRNSELCTCVIYSHLFVRTRYDACTIRIIYRWRYEAHLRAAALEIIGNLSLYLGGILTGIHPRNTSLNVLGPSARWIVQKKEKIFFLEPLWASRSFFSGRCFFSMVFPFRCNHSQSSSLFELVLAFEKK